MTARARRGWWAVPVAGALLVACGSDEPGAGDGSAGATAESVAEPGTDPVTDSLAARRDLVAERGAQVMPFDLDATTHHFTDTSRGGIQDVVADDPTDHEQVALIRAHLAEEAERFAAGDFGDPAAIHGHDMPGLADLEARHDEIEVVYEELPDGARLTYTTRDPDLVRSLHDWFEAQVHDHGDHAEAG